MRRFVIAALTLGTIDTFALTAPAYTIREAADNHPVHWSPQSVTVTVDPSITEIDPAARAAITAAMATWQAVSDAHIPTVALQDGAADEIGYRPGETNQNTIRYAPKGVDLAGSALGITVVTFDAQGNILDADVILNGGGPRKFVVLANAADAPDKNRYDVQNVATHESGHFFGLGENLSDTDATMFITSARGETKKRDLTDDDEAGVRELYAGASPANAASCAMSAGRVPARAQWLGVAVVAAAVVAALAARSGRRRLAVGGTATLAMAALFGPISMGNPATEATDAHEAASIGRVVTSSARREGGLIVTKLALETHCKDGPCPSDRVEVEIYGGKLNGLTQIIGHGAVPTVGDEVPLGWQDGRVIWLSRVPVRHAPEPAPKPQANDRTSAILSTKSKADPRRLHERAPLGADVRLIDGAETAGAVAENVSEGGLFIATDAQRKTGELVALELDLPGLEAPIRVTGEVRWQRRGSDGAAPGLGVRFVDLDSEQAEQIRAYVADSAATSAQ